MREIQSIIKLTVDLMIYSTIICRVLISLLLDHPLILLVHIAAWTGRLFAFVSKSLSLLIIGFPSHFVFLLKVTGVFIYISYPCSGGK